MYTKQDGQRHGRGWPSAADSQSVVLWQRVGKEPGDKQIRTEKRCDVRKVAEKKQNKQTLIRPVRKILAALKSSRITEARFSCS